jgi:hypothetical protein
MAAPCAAWRFEDIRLTQHDGQPGAFRWHAAHGIPPASMRIFPWISAFAWVLSFLGAQSPPNLLVVIVDDLGP